jgi:hypothetical protein
MNLLLCKRSEFNFAPSETFWPWISGKNFTSLPLMRRNVSSRVNYKCLDDLPQFAGNLGRMQREGLKSFAAFNAHKKFARFSSSTRPSTLKPKLSEHILKLDYALSHKMCTVLKSTAVNTLLSWWHADAIL